MSRKAFSRRSFIGGLAAAGALDWVYDSNALMARVVRGTIDDVQREVEPLPPADLSGWSDRSVDLLWVGHATVLINIFGVHILTDPVLFDWIGADIGVATVGRKRWIAPALDPAQLPRIDLVLLSHAHFDHMDLPSLECIPASTPVISAPRTTDVFAGRSFSRTGELRWGEKQTVRTPRGEVGIQALEVKHSGARWRSDTYRGYGGYLLERGGKTILFGGDTAYSPAFKTLRGRKIEVALMPIGSYGSHSGNHCTPEATVRMTDECGADRIVPIHHRTFPIGQEPMNEPLERLRAAINPDRIVLEKPGQMWRLPG